MAFVHSVPASLSTGRPTQGSNLSSARRPASYHLTAPARMTIAVPRPMAAPADTKEQVVEPIAPLVGTQPFLDALEKNADRLVVVEVFAPWCRSCRALEPKVRRLAREFDNVAFFSMNYEDEQNKPVCFRLGVTSMPTFLFYHGAAGLIDKFTCGPNRAEVLRAKIQQIADGECPVAVEEKQA